MRALILEDDDLVAELIETVVSGLYPGISSTIAETTMEARAEKRSNKFDLYIVDKNLPDGSGLGFVKQVRETDEKVPIVVVSGSSDRGSVLQAARYDVNGYIAKPFDVVMLHERLESLLKPDLKPEKLDLEDKEDSSAPDLETLLQRSLKEPIQLPSNLNPADILDLSNQQDSLSIADLVDQWQKKASLTTRLLKVANSISLRRSGSPANTLKDAIWFLGIPATLNQALAFSLDVSSKFESKALSGVAKTHHKAALRVATEAQKLAAHLKKSPDRFQQAGLLSHLGEMAVCKVLDHYVALGGEIDVEEAEKIVSAWAQPYGNQLKIQWKLPLETRELIGATHQIPHDCVRMDRLIMRAAHLLARSETDSDEYFKLMSRIGMLPQVATPQRKVNQNPAQDTANAQ